MKIFEDTFTQHKEELTQAFIVFNEGSRLYRVLSDEEEKRPDYYKFHKAGQQAILQELEKYLSSYKPQSKLPMTDEFNRGWVSAFSCVVKDLEKLFN